MSNYPFSLDDDSTIAPISDNISEIGESTINAIRAAIFNIEGALGVSPNGSALSVSDRLSTSLNDDGSIRSSALLSAGLVALPITNSQISSVAAIDEDKLNLTFSTQYLYNLFANLNSEISNLNNFVSIEGIKIAPHIAGVAYNHNLSAILMDAGTLNRVDLASGEETTRNLTNAYTFTSTLSNDLLQHVQADGVSDNTTPPVGKAHNATGIAIDPAYFESVPHTIQDLQSFAEYVDSSSLALLGSRTQNLYENGIPRAARVTSLINDEAAEALVPPTPAITYLLYNASTSPVDDIDHGDDIIFLQPTSDVLSNNTFDAQFSQVRPGDYITVSYDGYTTTTQFVIDSVKKFQNGSSRTYTVRIKGKNLKNSSDAIVRIDRCFYHDQKFNSLAVSQANNKFDGTPSLIIGSAQGASALGVGFFPDQFDGSHYNLYLAFYPTGNPLQNTFFLPAIDITGNQGATPGLYTLENIVFNINEAVRQPGFNYRLNAFAYQGSIGIALTDPYNDASFSIISGTTDTNGAYTSTSLDGYPNNVVDNFNGLDPLGFGVSAANIATPPFATSYSSALASLNAPTLIFSPLRRSFFYVDGVERDNFALETLITRDAYGDGYWLGTITSRTSLSGRVEATYEVDLDLSPSGLEIGKTIIVQPAVDWSSGSYNQADYGRFIISNVVFNNCPGPTPVTLITVYDAVHGIGLSPSTTSIDLPVKLYFDSDSASFDGEQVSDPSTNKTFRRFFEVYMDSDGTSCTHERARFNISGTSVVIDSANGVSLYSDPNLYPLKIVSVSPKLSGFSFSQYKKINLFINSYDATTGLFTGNLGKFVYPSTYSQPGPTFTGKKGEIVRAYDATEVDYIDFKFDINESMTPFTSAKLDIQLFPSLSLNQEKMLISTCQINDISNKIENIYDVRSFGNVSEQQLSTSALNYIAAPQRLLNENGVIRGFDLIGNQNNEVQINGGAAIINGQIVEFNNKNIFFPAVQETLAPSFGTTINQINWFICANSSGDLELIADTDYNPNLSGTYGSLDHNRLFYVKNPNSSGTPPYAVRSGYLSKVINEYNDVVPLYIVSSTTSSTTASVATPNDIRRFISSGYGGLSSRFILSNTGSYRTFDALVNTLNELLNNISYSLTNSNINSQQVIVRDNFDISDYTLDFNSKVKFIGDGGSFNIATSSLEVVQNTTFQDLVFNVSSATGIYIAGSNITISNCIFNYTYDATSDGQFTVGQTGNFANACIWNGFVYEDGTNLDNGTRYNFVVKNCQFTTNKANHYPFIVLELYTAQSNYFHENVSIIDNFMSFSGTGDDKRANIAIVGASNTTPPNGVAGRIINCEIARNTFNKNQSIIFSGQENNASKLVNLPVPINVSIKNNVCGAICYLAGSDIPLTTYNTAQVQDKDNGLTISSNTCRYIYTGTAYGFVNVIGQTHKCILDIVSGANVYSASTIISNNVCSWIHVGVKNPINYAFGTPLLRIANNKLNAFNPSYLSDYWSSISPTNIGLNVDNCQGS